jgi:hypothetical protein
LPAVGCDGAVALLLVLPAVGCYGAVALLLVLPAVGCDGAVALLDILERAKSVQRCWKGGEQAEWARW